MNFHNCIVSATPLPIKGAGTVMYAQAREMLPFRVDFAKANPEGMTGFLHCLDVTLEQRLASRRDFDGKAYSLVCIDLEDYMPNPAFKDWPAGWAPDHYVEFLTGIIGRLSVYASRVWPGVPFTVYAHAIEPYWLRTRGDGREVIAARWDAETARLATIRLADDLPSMHVYPTRGQTAAQWGPSIDAFGRAMGGRRWAGWVWIHYDGDKEPLPTEQLEELASRLQRAGATDVVWFGSTRVADKAQAQAITLRVADQVPALEGIQAAVSAKASVKQEG
jgi:hypothetical protein